MRLTSKRSLSPKVSHTDCSSGVMLCSAAYLCSSTIALSFTRPHAPCKHAGATLDTQQAENCSSSSYVHRVGVPEQARPQALQNTAVAACRPAGKLAAMSLAQRLAGVLLRQAGRSLHAPTAAPAVSSSLLLGRRFQQTEAAAAEESDTIELKVRQDCSAAAPAASSAELGCWHKSVSATRAGKIGEGRPPST